MTSNSQPAIDRPAISTAGAVAPDLLMDFDITAAVPGDGVYCFALESSSPDGVAYGSREATSGGPTVRIATTCAWTTSTSRC